MLDARAIFTEQQIVQRYSVSASDTNGSEPSRQQMIVRAVQNRQPAKGKNDFYRIDNWLGANLAGSLSKSKRTC